MKNGKLKKNHVGETALSWRASGGGAGCKASLEVFSYFREAWEWPGQTLTEFLKERPKRRDFKHPLSLSNIKPLSQLSTLSPRLSPSSPPFLGELCHRVLNLSNGCLLINQLLLNVTPDLVAFLGSLEQWASWDILVRKEKRMRLQENFSSVTHSTSWKIVARKPWYPKGRLEADLGTSWCWLGQQILSLADLQKLKLSFCSGPRVGALLLQPREADPGTNAASLYQCACSTSIGWCVRI